MTNFIHRNGENKKQFLRSGRFYHTDGKWFFKTREGFNYGPYSNRTECKYAYSDFLDLVASSNQLGDGTNLDSDASSGWKIPKINLG